MESHLHALIAYFTAHPILALGAIFAAALLEALAVIGTVVPGSSIVFVGGVLIGLGAIDPRWTAGAAVSGAILGDAISYWLGRRYHERLRSIWPVKSHAESFERGKAYFAKHRGKSVFLGRFLGPIRAIEPVVAGMSDMPPVRFYVANVLSAIAWAAAHMLPGVLFGASLQLADAVSSRLLILLGLVLLSSWTLACLVRLLQRRAGPLLKEQRDGAVRWAQARSGLLPRLVLSLFDPARAESTALLIAAITLLGGAWLFFGILEDVLSNDPLVRLDHATFAALQSLRNAWTDDVMVAATELGSAAVALPVIAAVSVLLGVKRCWRTLAYWLSAMGFAQLLVWALKMSLGRARPTTLYSGVDSFSFPSGHAASSIVLYGFLAFLLARGRPAKLRLSIALLAVLTILLISFSRLYLGAHWLSDVLASLSLGTAWVALLSIAYTQHVRAERLPARALALVALGTFAIAGAFHVGSRHEADVAWYAARSAVSETAMLPDWRNDGWRRLPARRTDVGGEAEEPMLLQWAGAADRIAAMLETAGWRDPVPWTAKTTLLWLLPSTPIGEVPVLTKFDHGEPQRLSFEKVLDERRRLVIQLWPTRHVVDTEAGGGRPLWNGMVTLERLESPAGIITLAMTDHDYVQPLWLFARQFSRSGVTIESRPRGNLPVLLLW